MKVVFLSHTVRGSVFRVGSHHLSKRFSDLGHEVLYISSPLSLFHCLYHLTGRKLADYEQRSKARSFFKDSDEIVNHVPFLLFPYINKGLFRFYKIYKNYNLNFSSTYKVIKEYGFQKPDLVIQDSLKLNFCRKYFQTDKWVYRATDLYSEMPEAPSTIKEAEREAVITSDYVYATSAPLKKYLEDTYGVKVSILRNGVDYNHFDKKRKKPKEFEVLKGPICIYVGSMDDRFDNKLVLKIARKNLNVVLVGPTNPKEFKDYDNIICLGEIEYDKLPAYLQYSDVGLLPLKVTEANHHRSPMKIYEYGASGLPVVSKRLIEVERRNSKFVYLADSDQEFIQLVMEAIQNKEALGEEAKVESKKFSWNLITEEFISLSDK